MEQKDIVRMAAEAELVFVDNVLSGGRPIASWQEDVDLTPYLVRFAQLVEVAVLADLVAREGGTA